MNLAILGYLMMALMMVILLKGWLTPIVGFVFLPIVFALLAGFGFADISDFVKSGVPSTLSSAGLALFATTYFRIMTEQGLFDPAVKFLSKRAGGNVSAILIITVLISAISHMDTGTTSTILVTIPAMLPLYRANNIRVEWLFLMIAQAVACINMLPHGGGTIRVSAATGVEGSALFHNILPIIIVMMVYNVISAYFYGKIEQKRIAAGKNENMDNGEGKESGRKQEIRDIPITWRYWANLATTVGLLVLMFLDKFPGYFVFMIGLSIALMVNYTDTKKQIAAVKEYGADAVYIVAIMLCSGVLVGIMKGTGMLDAMALAIVNIIPQGIKNFYALLIGYISIPLSICLGADGFYYGLAPLFTQVGAEYGFTAATIGAIMIIARDAFGNITPVSPVTYLAPGMLGKDLGAFIKFSFPWLLLYFTVEMLAGILLGIVPIL